MILSSLMAILGQKPAWGDAIACPVYSSATVTGAIGPSFTGCAVGATGPTYGMASTGGRISGLPYLDELPRDLSDVTKVIRRHRRVYLRELSGNESLLNLMRNRIVVRTMEYYSRTESETIMGRYIDWLDDHNSGLYMIDEASNKFEFVISFEMEPDLIQFAIALR